MGAETRRDRCGYPYRLHIDHCAIDFKCVDATLYVHAKELAQIHDSHPLDLRYNEESIHKVKANRQIQTITEGREFLPAIRVVHTPAHTEGGLTLLISTPP